MKIRALSPDASNLKGRANYFAAIFVCSALAATVIPSLARAEEVDPKALLKAMSDYLSKQATISAKFNSSVEVITPELEKIQFDSSSTLQLKRPDKLKLERVGGYAAVEMVFDGNTLSVRDVDNKKYAQADVGGSIDELVDHMRDELGIGAPGADLLLADVYGALNGDVVSAQYVGQGVIDGVECEHLAFRNLETDWQIWVKKGPEPIPCKMVITSKTVTAAPQYTVEVRDWQSGQAIEDAVFKFKPDGAGSKVDLKDMSGLDEVPPPATEGAQE